MTNTFNFKRLFSSSLAKGQRDYLNSQKKYEIIRTVFFFGVSIGLYVMGLVTTSSNMNMLTVIAILGCLPASKSLVQTIMFLRYKSCPADLADKIENVKGSLGDLYDNVFTSYQKNFFIDHLVVCGHTICGFSGDSAFPEKEFQQHIETILKAENIKNVTIKIFTDIDKYTERLVQLQGLEADEKVTTSILSTLLSVSL